MSRPSEPSPPAAESELQAFGLSDADESWLTVFRAAADAAPLGRLGPFELLAEIGRGGQGVVYRARAPGYPGDVAIKRLLAGPRADPRALRRFEREAEVAARLDHPAIVRAIERAVVDDHVLLIMEWVDGVPVTEWADADESGRRRSIADVISMFLCICEAVQHAHQRGVIHRDLKPGNILVARSGRGDPATEIGEPEPAAPRPKLLDFGIARLDLEPQSQPDSRRLTATEHFIGTPAYAAPEQLRGHAHDADVRADVYSLGVILFRMLTGELPFDTTGSLLETVRTICETPAAWPSARRREIRRDLDAIVLKTLEKDAVQRYASVEALAADVRRYVAGQAVLAHPPRTVYRLRKFIGRHRLAVCLAGAVALSLGVGVAAVTTLAFRLARETVATSAARDAEAVARGVAERVAAFLRDTLASARPGRGGGDARVLEMLRAAETRAAEELADQPAVAAEVYFTIGQTYRTLWLWREALTPLEHAVRLYREIGGPSNEPLARSLTMLGTCLSNTSDPRCVEVHREALALRRVEHSGDHPLVAEGLMRLGYALYRGFRDPHSPEAATLLDEALAMYQRLYPAPHRDTAACLHNIGYMRWQRQELAAAIVDYEAALEILRACADRSDPFFIECLNGYASLLDRSGRTHDAIAAWEELRPLLAEHFGRDWLYEPTLREAAALLELDECGRAAELYAEATRLAAARAVSESPERSTNILRAAEALEAALLASRDGLSDEPLLVIDAESPAELRDVADALARIRAARGLD